MFFFMKKYKTNFETQVFVEREQYVNYSNWKGK